jgi:hypothetical protein
VKRLLDDAELTQSPVVANNAMNRTRRLSGRDGYSRVLGIDLAGFLPFRYLGADEQVGPNYAGQPAVHSTYELSPNPGSMTTATRRRLAMLSVGKKGTKAAWTGAWVRRCVVVRKSAASCADRCTQTADT